MRDYAYAAVAASAKAETERGTPASTTTVTSRG